MNSAPVRGVTSHARGAEMIESPLLQNLTGYIGGRWTDSAGGSTFDVYNPATGEVIAKVPSMPEQDILDAVDAGKQALRLTNPYPLETRRKWLEDIRDALKDNREEIADVFQDRKSTRLNSSHVKISYAVFCLKKKK